MQGIMNKFLFIVGVGRSGTSLLQSMLHTHDEIIFTPERQFIRRYYASFLKRYLFNRLKVEEKVELVSRDKRYSNLNATVIGEELKKLKPDEDYIGKMLSLGMSRQDVAYIGEKDARNIDYLEILRNVAGSKIIHIHRDPRDVILSKSRASWSKGKGWFLNSLVGRIQLLNFKFGCKDCYELSYESLLSDPSLQLKNVCEFLGLRFDSKMLSFQASAKSILISDTERSFKQKNFSDLDRKNFNKWKVELSLFSVFVTECLYFHWMESKGYEFHFPKELLRVGSILFSPFLMISYIIYNIASKIV